MLGLNFLHTVRKHSYQSGLKKYVNNSKYSILLYIVFIFNKINTKNIKVVLIRA